MDHVAEQRSALGARALDGMNVRDQFEEFSSRVSELCSHISVREDEEGPYVFALGLESTHTLQLRKVNDRYVVQLWHGPDVETETIVEEPSFQTAEAAFDVAEQWLQRDAIKQHAQLRPPTG